MAPTIEIDDEVFAKLQEMAVPFVDSPNSVMRRVLGLDSADSPRPTTRHQRWKARQVSGGRLRARAGTSLPGPAYYNPILSLLAQHGGTVTLADMEAALEEALSDKLTDVDRETMSSGEVRWKNRIRWARYELVRMGLLARGGRRGTWTLTATGWDAAKSGEIPGAA
jgi:hypothetical protein